MKRISLFIFILATQLTCAFSQDVLPLLKYAGTMKKLDVLIGGTTYPFLFDTGGGDTIVTPELAAIAGKKIYGRGVGYRMHGEMITYQKCDLAPIKLGATEISPQTAAIFDIMSLFPPKAPKIYGMLSLKAFNDKIISIDLPAGTLTVETGKSAKKKKKKMTLLESRFSTGLTGNEATILLGIRRNGVPYWFLFDTGNGHHPLISPQTAFDWGLQQDPASTGTTHQTELSFGTRNETFGFDADDIIYDGVLNYEIISKRAYLIDFPNKQIWMN